MAEEANTIVGSPELIAALAAVFDLEHSLWGWCHTEEHWFRHDGFDSLSDWFDKKHEQARDRRRDILDRIFQLGGDVGGVGHDPAEALEEVLVRLKAIHAACQRAYEAAEDPDDYVTSVLLAENQKCIEKQIEKLEAKLAKKDVIGEQLWLERLI